MNNSSQRAARIEADVILVGAGLAGLSTAILLAKEGLSVVALDRAAHRPESDLRTTALLEPAIATLSDAGVWPRLDGRAATLNGIRLIEAEPRRENSAGRTEANFTAQEIDREFFGANVANAELKRALMDQAAETEGLTLIAPAQIEQLLLRRDNAYVQLSDGRSLIAPVIVGADGRRSAVRKAAGVSAFLHDYAQNALVFVVAHEAPHNDVSCEILTEGGPFTLVPFTPDPTNGGARSSVVWMERRARASRLMTLSDAEFEAAAQERSLDILGPLSLVSSRANWPIATLLAAQFHGRRAILMGEAAHVSPPIGAQGLNMSLGDAQALRDLLRDARSAGEDIGASSVLARFTRRRYADVAARLATTAALNTAAIGALQPIRDMRRVGLRLIHDIKPLKQAAMRFGLG